MQGGKRASIFRDKFHIDKNTRILGLGSEGGGSNINFVLKGKSISPGNVYIADIDRILVNKGALRYGFTPVVVDESGRLPFDDGFFDIVYCSSVIEHVTAPKNIIWSI